MSQISKIIRADIIAAAIKARFSTRVDDLKAQETALALRFYSLVFNKDVVAIANSLPDGWLRSDKCLRFQLGFRSIVLNIHGEIPGPVVPSDGYGCRNLGLIENEDAVAAFEAFTAAKNQLERDSREAQIALGALLASCKTIKRLREMWPEGAAFYSKYEEVRTGLPTVTSERVNALLGLTPVQEGEQAA